CCAASAGRTRPGPYRESSSSTSRSCRGGRSHRCPRATAIWGSCSPVVNRPHLSRRPCGRPTICWTSTSRPTGRFDPVRVLLVSTYELGHQPWHLASPAAALSAAGHEVRTLDLAVDPWDDEAVASAEGVGFSVPMHTALRLAEAAATRVRSVR